MSNGNQFQPHWRLVFLVVGIAAAMASGVWLWRNKSQSTVAGRPVPTPDFESAVSPSSPTSANTGSEIRPEDLLISLSPEKLANAELKVESVMAAATAPLNQSLRATGTVQSNPYKETPVMPIVGGIVRAVSVTLGEPVTQGQKLATLFSTELSEAQTAYLKVQAEIEKHHKHFRRAADLVELGAISREEFEDIQSQYKTEQAELGAAKQRLLLYGLNEKQIAELTNGNELSALITITAPTSGIVLTRSVNPGEVVSMGKELFRLADLSTVWVIGQVYEQDLASVSMGATASVTAAAYPQRNFTGRVTYVDPRIEPQTRTAQVRLEVNNAAALLKLGMFVDVNFGGKATTQTSASIMVPRSAIQFIGNQQVVFVKTAEAGGFAQRIVETGSEFNGAVPVLSGLNFNDQVVTQGSFLLRAESLKVHPTQVQDQTIRPPKSVNAPTESSSTPDKSGKTATQSATIVVNAMGYQPATLRLRPGIPARVTFIRNVEASCGTEIVLVDYDIRRDLPLGKPVTIEFTPASPGEFKFSCGMDMLKGSLIVK